MFFWLTSKLMRFEARNPIIDDSDSKAIYIDRRFWSDSIFNDLIKSTIAISIKNRSFSIYFWSIFDEMINLNQPNID